MQSVFTITWIDAWLAGLVHPACRADLVERSRHERFLVARTASALGALAALPPFLLGDGMPTVLQTLALIALTVPVAAVAALSRSGRLDLAQSLVSLALAPFAAAAVARYGGLASPALCALALIPIDALLAGRHRAVPVAFAAAVASVPLAWALPAHVGGSAQDLAAVVTVGLALGCGHALAQIAFDGRLPALLRDARAAGEAREGATLAAIDDLVTWHDRNGSVLRASSAAARLLGLPASALQGRGLFDRVHVADRPAYLKAISDAATSPEPVTVQLRLQFGSATEAESGCGSILARPPARSRPRVIWVEIRAHRFPSQGSSPCAVVAVTRGVSQHRERIEALEAHGRRSEQEREARAQLLASVGESLQARLDAILGYAERIGEKSAPARLVGSRDYAPLIREAGQSARRVASNLRELASLEAGHRDLAPELLDVPALVAESCAAAAPAAEQAGVALAREVAPDLPPLQADPRACRQILHGLLRAAIAATPRSGCVALEARRQGDRLSLTVRDAGPRRPQYPVELGRTAQEAALGVEVARRLVALHGGRLEVAGSPGSGFVATVLLALAANPRSELPLRRIGGLRILEGGVALKTDPHILEGAVAVKTDPRIPEGTVALRTDPRIPEGAVAVRTG